MIEDVETFYKRFDAQFFFDAELPAQSHVEHVVVKSLAGVASDSGAGSGGLNRLTAGHNIERIARRDGVDRTKLEAIHDSTE